MENTNGKMPTPDQVSKGLDPELRNYYVDIKQSLSGDYTDYIKNHPEIRQLLNDYMSSLLLHKPENVFAFTKDYFAFFNKDGEGLKSKGPIPLIVCGPSGVGKGTVIKQLFEKYPNTFEFSVSYTTRGPREGEVHGKSYFFVSKEDFQEGIKNNDFLEHVEYSGNFYGTSKSYIKGIQERGHICVLDIELVGVEKLIVKGLAANVVFLLPPSIESLRERLIGRGTETADAVEKRINRAKMELELAPKKSFITKRIVNDELNACHGRVVEFLKEKYPDINF